jgi:surfactin synthase thioesterase subunit
MTRLIDGHAPGLLVDPSCKLTIRALTTEYQWTVTAGRRGEEPLKNWASHLVEAHQYALLDGGHFHQVMARQAMRASTRPIMAKTTFNVFAR